MTASLVSRRRNRKFAYYSLADEGRELLASVVGNRQMPSQSA